MLMPLLNSYLKLTLVWSAMFLVFDLFHRRKFLEGRGKIILCVFLFTYLISIVLNRQTSFRMNLIGFAYITVQMLILTIPSSKPVEETEKISECIYKIGVVFSTIGVLLYLMQVNNDLLFNGKFYPIGFYSSRLIGIYRNITSPSLAFITLFTLYYIIVRKVQYKFVPGLAYYGLVINFIHLMLSNSKGVLIGTRIFMVVFIALLLFWKELHLSLLKKVTLIFVTLGLSLIFFSFTLNIGQKMLSYAPSKFFEKYQFRSNLDDPDFEIVEGPVDLDREVPEHYDKLTGRPLLWKQGIEAFLEKPIFGHGAYSNAGKIGFEFSSQKFTTYHNAYIHTLFSAGILGSISLFSYFIFLVYISFYLVIKMPKALKEDRVTVAFVVGILAMSAVIGMGETNLLFMNRFHEYVFWFSVGILISYDFQLHNKEIIR